MSNSAKKTKKKFQFFKKLQVSDAKTKKFFFKKKSWSHMIPNCIIRREMQKKNFFWFFFNDTKTLGNY